MKDKDSLANSAGDKREKKDFLKRKLGAVRQLKRKNRDPFDRKKGRKFHKGAHP